MIARGDNRPSPDDLPNVATHAGRHVSPLDRSLQLIMGCGLRRDDPIIDVSGGDGSLVGALLLLGYTDVTVVQSSPVGFSAFLERLGDWESCLTVLRGDVTQLHLKRRFALWHDRGSFCLLEYPEDRQRYVEVLEEALRPEGHLVIATIGPEGPQQYGSQRVRCYSQATLTQEMGCRFELAEHSLDLFEAPSGEHHHFLHCRFRRHAPHPSWSA